MTICQFLLEIRSTLTVRDGWIGDPRLSPEDRLPADRGKARLRDRTGPGELDRELGRFDNACVGGARLGEIVLALVGLPEQQIVMCGLEVQAGKHLDRASVIAKPEGHLSPGRHQLAARVQR